MKILNFKAENFKRLDVVEISPDGSVVKITGKNGAGKTSILDAIMVALDGLGSAPSKPIRKGQSQASVTLDLGDMIVTRRFKEKEGGAVDSSLEIRNKEGARFPSPQKMLDELVGRLAFDPLEFMRLKAAEKFLALRDLLQLDFSDLDSKRQAAYDNRTDHGRRYRELVAQRDAIKFDADGVKVEVVTTALLAEYQEAIAFNRGIDDAKSRIEEVDAAIQRREDEIAQLEQQIVDKRDEISRHKARKPNYEAIIMQQPRDLEAIKARIDSSESDNRNARAFQQFNTISVQVADVEAKGKACAETIKACDDAKAARIAQATMPVEGLEFGDGLVLYKGIPLEQASAAEQLRVSVAMAMAMNPKLRVLRITDGSLLDSDSMKALEAMAVGADYQVWVELVDESGQVGIVIEDGHVKESRPEA